VKKILRTIVLAAVVLALLLPLVGAQPAIAASATLRPIGDGDINITYKFPDSGDHWDKVDDVVADDDTTYVYSTSFSFQDDLYTLSDLGVGGAIISSVTIRLRARIGECGGCWGYDTRTVIKTHDAVYNSAAFNTTDTWADYSTAYTTNPYTGTAWTVAEVDDLQAGVGLYAGPAMCTQVWVDVAYTTVGAPAIVTSDASAITQTSARLNSAVTDDGGVACQVRWGYGKVQQTAENFEEYTVVSAWAGSYTTGQHPYYDIAGLDAEDTYYFRVQIKNSGSPVTGDEKEFDTLSGLGDPSGLRGYPSANSIDLSWTKGAGSVGSMLRYGLDAFPSTYNDGYLAYEGTATDYNHTGLASGRTYYYAIWAVSGEDYSTGSSQVMVTTSAPTATSDTIEAPPMPSGWLASPDYTSMSGLGPLYDAINSGADSLSMPRGTVWFLLATMIAVGISVVVYLKARNSIVVGFITLLVMLVIQWAQHITPFWVPIFVLIIAISAFLVHRRETP